MNLVEFDTHNKMFVRFVWGFLIKQVLNYADKSDS